MPAYITVSLNHFAAIQAWTNDTGGQAILDMRDFSLEVKHRGRYYRMYPMFQGRIDGQLVHMQHLTRDVQGFGGWRPYQFLRHPSSSDKKLFKDYLSEQGLRSPAILEAAFQPPGVDYVLKARNGSFGRGLLGPYRAGSAPQVLADEIASSPSGVYAEQFVYGQMLKVWYWGATPFFAHAQAYPDITGDGVSAVSALMHAKMSAARRDWNALAGDATILACLAFQGLTLDDVLTDGKTAWIDFRYAQLYEPFSGSTTASDNQLDSLAAQTGNQLAAMGDAVANLLRETIPLPVMVTVDGLLDAAGHIWWLEMNTNSLMPPEGYATMFSSLFA